jgi:hypothetical protein
MPSLLTAAIDCAPFFARPGPRSAKRFVAPPVTTLDQGRNADSFGSMVRYFSLEDFPSRPFDGYRGKFGLNRGEDGAVPLTCHQQYLTARPRPMT